MGFILTALLVIGFVLLAWITNRGRAEAQADYQRQQHDKKADLLIAQVREELGAKDRTGEG